MTKGKVAAFILTSAVGLAATESFRFGGQMFQPGRPESGSIVADLDYEMHSNRVAFHAEAESGFAACGGRPAVDTVWDTPSDSARVAVATSPLKILSKKKAQYTEEAKKNSIEGTVTLRVTFLEDGTIGKNITTVKGLPYGLTEQAIAAAWEIKFVPERVNGIPRTTTRPVSFTFNIY